MMNIRKPIATFVPNLKTRTDRKESIIKEFEGRPEFALTVVEAKEHTVGAVGLWNTIVHILNDLVSDDDELIILCEDDHIFTEHYCTESLLRYITIAQALDTDVLLGGISGSTSIMPVADNLYWVEKFSGLQFTVIFPKFFKTIIDAYVNVSVVPDYYISFLSNRKLAIYPFISTQKEFGYSDATQHNNEQGRVTAVFNASIHKMAIVKDVAAIYKNRITAPVPVDITDDYDNICIPTYLIVPPEKMGEIDVCLEQFSDRPEFELIITQNRPYDNWETLLHIVNSAMANDDDVIIVCKCEHTFPADYSKDHLLKNILEAHAHGFTYLAGNAADFGYVVPLTENQYWVNKVTADFIVLYSSIFPQILNTPFDNPEMTIDNYLCELTSNKALLFPFVSVQQDIELKGHNRLIKIKEAYDKYASGVQTVKQEV